MASTNNFARLVEDMRERVICSSNDPTLIEPAIKECGRHIRTMNATLKTTTFVGERLHITNCVSHMQGFRTMLKSLRHVVGIGYTPAHPNRKNYTSQRVKWVDLESAFASRIRTAVVINLQHKDPNKFLEDAKDQFRRRVENILKKETIVKVNAVFCGEFVINKGGEEIREFKYFNTKNFPIYKDTIIQEWFTESVYSTILTQLEEFQERDSGWGLSAIVNIVFNINRYNPLSGSSFIELPRSIKLKRACVNVRNNDHACFAWAVTSALFQCNKNTERMTSYPHYSQVLNLENISLPMTIKQIPRFEVQNATSINVYTLEKSKKESFIVAPTYLTKSKQDRHVNLLLIQDVYDNDEDGGNNRQQQKPQYHYVWIKSLSRLLSAQLSKHGHMKHICDRCLHYFASQEKLEKHYEDCMTMNECRARLPTADQASIKFKNYKNKEPAPFVIYADIECVLAKPSKTKEKQQKNVVQEHIPYSIGYYVKCSYDDSLSFYKSYRGEDCQKWFSNEMKQFAEDVETVFSCSLPMECLSQTQILDFESVVNCHICELPFGGSDEKVRDHCHFTGKYRGPAHKNCNINYKDTHVIPVVFHNLSGYDSHFIIKNLARDFDGRIDLLPINKEKYISFTKHVDGFRVQFRFIDSFKFLADSLEKLAWYLIEYPNLRREFGELEDSKFQLLTRKGTFPYDYVSNFAKLNETCLPKRENFYNKLTDSCITEEQHQHATLVWDSFDCQSLGQYSDIYLKTDILLLTDVFEQFRRSCLKTYGLDPAHYFTLPGYTWDCMLKHVNMELQLLTDIDMILFIERSIRGGLSQCSKRYAQANNQYLKEYDENKKKSYLMYYDINNQYGWAMSQCLPYDSFGWIDDVDNFNFNVPDDHPEGYILEVDLEYPQELHDLHADLPFCPEHMTVPHSKCTKLMATLYNKQRYVIHYRNLKQALENGLTLTKIHRVLKFKQSPWLRSYIDLNTKLRTNASNDFEKNLFKLMNNAVFGKTIENIRKYSIVKLVTKWEGRYGAEALIAKPNFKSSTIFDENLVAIELNKTQVFFNKPIYIGMSILDISKLKIYDFHYSYMRDTFGDKAKVCYTDTDSLIYHVECDDIYQVMKRDCFKYFDTSDYAVNNAYNIPRVNKKVLGLMKDENNGRVMSQFVGLRSKMYSCKVDGADDTVKKAKGVKKHIVKNNIDFDDYVSCLKEAKETVVHQLLFRTNKHQVTTISQSKLALSPHDDKRYIIRGTYHTLPWGHYSIMNVD